ncbi:flagellar motor stator protein MotA [Rhodopila globiformis]|uniref:Flagellar motor stator protein MotA n=1 Tax=Rhodopila globiformis TaxID=1071 RepID=A0A2S6MZ31_RHOGL|nr:flagellar motor stator protein MotA [Rhodopila globiformis]PPQ27621.1 flagellar motor stator protein MotA [Rhodopila globiformis]
MWQIIGIIGVFAAIGTGYTISGGKFAVILHAAAPELLTILGSGSMTVVIGNDLSTLKKLLGGFKKIFAGSRWKKGDYVDALCLVFLLTRVARQEGNMALEKHIENTDSSAIFQRYTRLTADRSLVAFIADVFRSITMNFTDPHKVGEMMETELEKRQHEELRAPKALTTMADSLPALGIVAAVLGVVKAMGAISEPPAVLGEMIGSALVGTLMGVFLAYGIVGPLAVRLKGVLEEEAMLLGMVRHVIVAYLEGLAPQLAVEVGRKSVPSHFQPSFEELDQVVTEAAKSIRTKSD